MFQIPAEVTGEMTAAVRALLPFVPQSIQRHFAQRPAPSLLPGV